MAIWLRPVCFVVTVFPLSAFKLTASCPVETMPLHRWPSFRRHDRKANINVSFPNTLSTGRHSANNAPVLIEQCHEFAGSITDHNHMPLPSRGAPAATRACSRTTVPHCDSVPSRYVHCKERRDHACVRAQSKARTPLRHQAPPANHARTL